jgi:hypothetical protein
VNALTQLITENKPFSVIMGGRAGTAATMPEVPAADTITAAGELRIGDLVTWLAGWNCGGPSRILNVGKFPAGPEYAGITGEPEVVHSRCFLTRRLSKDQLAARVLAKAITCRACGRPILARC